MLILRGGRVLTMEQPPFVGDVAVDAGRIFACAPHLDIPKADVVDLSGCYIMPGIIDAHCHVGLLQSGSRERDHNETTDPITPEMRGIDAVWPGDMAFAEARACGMTTCVTGPGSINLIGGTFAAVKTAGCVIDDMVLRSPVAMKAALGENPKFRYTERGKSPQSRMASAALIRKTLCAAQDYARAREKNDPAARNLGLEALLPVLSGELPLQIHAHRSDDIATAMRIAREFSLSYILVHGTEGYQILPHLQQALHEGCRGVVLGPMINYKGKLETANKQRFCDPARYYRAGIPFAICSDFFESPVERLITSAALSAAEGLPEEEALKSITLSAARITGIDDRVGSLRPGKDADIAVFSGHPLDYRSHCMLTLVDGQVVYQRNQEESNNEPACH